MYCALRLEVRLQGAVKKLYTLLLLFLFLHLLIFCRPGGALLWFSIYSYFILFSFPFSIFFFLIGIGSFTGVNHIFMPSYPSIVVTGYTYCTFLFRGWIVCVIQHWTMRYTAYTTRSPIYIHRISTSHHMKIIAGSMAVYWMVK